MGGRYGQFGKNSGDKKAQILPKEGNFLFTENKDGVYRPEIGSGGRAAMAWEASMRAFLFLFLSAAASAGAEDPQPWTRLSGWSSGVRDARRVVIADQGSWQRLWTEHSRTEGSPAAPPVVDFGREMVVGVFLGERPSSGYSVSLELGVAGRRRRPALVVVYRESRPRPGGVGLTVMTQPFELRRVPKAYRSIFFEERREAEGQVPGCSISRSEAESGSPEAQDPPVLLQALSAPARVFDGRRGRF